jgi:hypothetical protein
MRKRDRQKRASAPISGEIGGFRSAANSDRSADIPDWQRCDRNSCVSGVRTLGTPFWSATQKPTKNLQLIALWLALLDLV